MPLCEALAAVVAAQTGESPAWAPPPESEAAPDEADVVEEPAESESEAPEASDASDGPAPDAEAPAS